MTTSLLIINCLKCNCGLIDYWLFEPITHERWGYCSCIYPTFVYVSLKGIGVVGLDTYTWGIKDFHKCWLGSLAKRRLCLGPASITNYTPLSALSLWVSLFPRERGYNSLTGRWGHGSVDHLALNSSSLSFFGWYVVAWGAWVLEWKRTHRILADHKLLLLLT